MIKDIKEIVTNKKILIGILTVLIIIIIGTYYNKKNDGDLVKTSLKLGVINLDDSSYSDLLLTYFNSSDTFSSLLTVITGESDEIITSFENGEIDIYLEIPKNFAQNMIVLEHTPIKVVINIEDTTKAILFQNLLKSYEKYIAAVELNAVGLYDMMTMDGMDGELINDCNEQISYDMIFTALGKEAFFSFEPVDTFPMTSVAEYYVICVLIMGLLYAGLYIGFQILREVMLGTFSRIKTTQLSLFRFLLARVLLMSVMMTLFSYGAMALLHINNLSVKKVFFCLSISLFCVTFALFLSSLFKTTQRYILVGNLLIFYFVVIGGGIIPIQFLPQDIVRLSKLTPSYYMIKGILLIKQVQHLVTLDRIITGFLIISIMMFLVAVFVFCRTGETHEA